MRLIIKNYLFIILGIIIVGYIFFIRLFSNKLPKELPIIVTTIEVFFYIAIVLWFFFLSIFLLILWYKRQKNIVLRNSYLESRIKPLLNFYWKCLNALDNLIKDNISPRILGKNLLRFSKYYNNKIIIAKNQRKILGIYHCFVSLPGYLFLSIFFVDSIIIKKFVYIYQFAWLLLIPFIFNYIIFTFKEFSQFNINLYLKDICDVYYNSNHEKVTVQEFLENSRLLCSLLYETQEIDIPTLAAINLKESYLTNSNLRENDDISTRAMFFAQNLIVFRNIYMHTLIFNGINQAYGLILNSVKYFCYGCIWLYILLHGINYI